MSDRRRYPEKAPQPTVAISEESERAIVGYVLANPNQFFEVSGRLEASHFNTPRLARIWDAMQRCSDKGKTPDRRQISVYIKNDGGEETPLSVYAGILIHEATKNAEGFDFLAYVDTVIALAQKRALLAALDQARIQIAAADVATPVEDMVDEGVRAITSVARGGNDRYERTYGEWMGDLAQYVAANFDKEEGGEGLDPGLKAVTEVIGPLLPGKVYILAGMSGGGKSALVRQITNSAAIDGGRKGRGFAYIVSMEMKGREYAARGAAEFMGVPSYKIERTDVNRSEVEMLAGPVREMANKVPLIIGEKRRLPLDEIRSRLAACKRTRGLSLAVIDHILLIKHGSKDSLADRAMESVIEAKAWAGEFDIPIIMLAQLTESKLMMMDNPWPNAGHLYGGGGVQMNADFTAFIHLPEIVTARQEPSVRSGTKHDEWRQKLESQRGKAFFFNDKARGAEGRVKREMIFDGPTMSFRDI